MFVVKGVNTRHLHSIVLYSNKKLSCKLNFELKCLSKKKKKSKTFFFVFCFSEDIQTVISSSDPVCPVGYINFTKLRLAPKDHNNIIETIVKTSLDYVNDLNESSYSDLSDPGFNESELEIIEKENRIRETISRDDSVLDCLSRSNSISQGVSPVASSPVRVLTKCESLEENSMNALSPFDYEYEKNTISNTPNAVVNAKGWIWIAGIQGCGDCPKNGMEMALAQLKGISFKNLLNQFFYSFFFCCFFRINSSSFIQFKGFMLYNFVC